MTSGAKCNRLFLFSLLLMLCPDLKFFNNANLFIYFSAIYILINFNILLKGFRWKKSELVFGALLFLTFIIGAIQLQFREDVNGFYRELNGYIGFLLAYFAARIYCHNAGEIKINKLFKYMYKLFLWYTVILGGLQFIYIYFWHSTIIKQLFEFIMYRGGQYFYDYWWGGRISFLYGEPSFAGTYLFLFGFMAFYYCYQKNLYKKRYLYWTAIIIFSFNLLTLSTRFIFDLVLFAIAWFIVSSRIIKKKQLSILLITSLVLVPLVIYFVMQSDIDTRLLQAYNSLNFLTSNGDNSAIVRLELLYVSFVGFIKHPFFGVGVGNFYTALKEYMITPTNTMAAHELSEMIRIGSNITSYSFFTSTICESGLIGLLMVWRIIKKALWQKEKILKFCGIMILMLCIQTELYGFFLGAFWFAIFNSDLSEYFNFKAVEHNIINKKKEKLNENINSDPVL